MTEGIPISVCVACGHAVFPPRVLCPVCAGSDWEEQRVTGGVLTAATSARTRVDAERLVDNPIAEVRTDAGPVVIVRLLEAAPPGTDVLLGMQGGALVARPLRAPAS